MDTQTRSLPSAGELRLLELQLTCAERGLSLCEGPLARSELGHPFVGTADFNEANAGNVPLNQYTPQGMTLHTGPLTAILPGVIPSASKSCAIKPERIRSRRSAQ